MDNTQIEKALNRLFIEENHRIVFWNDPDQEFAITLSLLELPEGVNLIRLDQRGALEVKMLIERDDPRGRYLLYSPTEEPDYESDCLLDIRLYSRSFRADRASIILDQMGLSRQHLRDHIALRRKFFDDKQRLQKLRTLVASNDTEIDLDRKMIAVVVKAEQPEWFKQVPAKVWWRKWVADIQAVGSGEAALKYLANYLCQPPLPESQIERWDAQTVTFRYRENGGAVQRATVRGSEFVRRFLQHVLPKGFQRVRHYGWLGAAAGHKRERIGALLDWHAPELGPPAPLPPPKCPGCGQPMFLLGPLPRAPT